MSQSPSPVQGCFDGYRGGAFEGWAWRPDAPDEPVLVEVYANGFRLGEAAASLYRPDLRAAGIGHGRFGFSLPFPFDLERPDPVQVSIRVKDGPPLQGGDTIIGGAEPLGEGEAAVFQAFVAAVLGGSGEAGGEAAAPEPATHFIVHSPTGADARAEVLGAAEYSYAFVLKAFIPVLERFGQVHVVDDPATQVDFLYESHLLKGETTLFLSFAPPQRTTLGLRCPVVPVIAWEYPTIPAEAWDGWARHDWRWVLRQTGRVITLSRLAGAAVRATMGEDFPVAAIPAPVRDRRPDLHHLPMRPLSSSARLEVDGFVLDSRTLRFGPAMATPPLPGPGERPASIVLDGVVFTSVFSPKDGRKNWPDMVTAFLAAFADRADVTLVLKMIGADPEAWWWELFDRVSRMPAFACRVVVIHGFLDDQRYGALIAASHWVVNASNAEGLCLPLLEFMSAGRPALSPLHTAMADYLDETCAMVVRSDEEYCGWPHDTRMGMGSTRHQVSWSHLRDAYLQAERLVREEPDGHRAMGAAAAQRMEAFCGDEGVAERLSSFLGLGRLKTPPAPASALLAMGAPA